MPTLDLIARDLIVLLTIIITQHNKFHQILLNSDHESLYVVRVQFVQNLFTLTDYRSKDLETSTI